jgi:hypothetical protein
MNIDIRPKMEGGGRRGGRGCVSIVPRIEVQHKIGYKRSGQKEEKFLLILASLGEKQTPNL